jgi:hypothetical protein
LKGKVDNIILSFVPSVLIMLSIGHLVVAGIKWYSSNEPHKQPTTQVQNYTQSRKHIAKTKKINPKQPHLANANPKQPSDYLILKSLSLATI